MSRKCGVSRKCDPFDGYWCHLVKRGYAEVGAGLVLFILASWWLLHLGMTGSWVVMSGHPSRRDLDPRCCFGNPWHIRGNQSYQNEWKLGRKHKTSWKRRVNTLAFVGSRFCITSTQFCCWSVNTAIDNRKRMDVWLWVNKLQGILAFICHETYFWFFFSQHLKQKPGLPWWCSGWLCAPHVGQGTRSHIP